MSVTAQAAGETTAPRRVRGFIPRAPFDLPHGHRPGAVAVSAALRSEAALCEVEAAMLQLAGGGARDFAGRMAREHLLGGGKRLRARLALASLEVLGGERHDGVAWAAACELLHNATLVHDDLQDGDTTRRGRPTCWTLHGPAQAVNAGDLLLMLPFLALERVPASPDRRLALSFALARHAAATARGQSAEMCLAAEGRFGWDDYLAAVEGKTGALFQLPVEGAALLAGRASPDARTLAEAFRGLGTLFQLQDDVLDLYGEKGRGAAGSDLREGKVSALVVEHLSRHPEDEAWLRALLTLPRERTPQKEVERAMERFRAGGALEGVLARINRAAWEVASSPVLADEPGLAELAWELVCVALAPIGHLDDCVVGLAGEKEYVG
jgi:geranylgeranyl diphosphate synthase type I